MAFNGVGRFSIEPGESIALDGWRFGAGDDRGAPTFQPIPDPRSGQVVHEVEVPDHFRSITSAAELHRELGQWLQSSRAAAK